MHWSGTGAQGRRPLVLPQGQLNYRAARLTSASATSDGADPRSGPSLSCPLFCARPDSFASCTSTSHSSNASRPFLLLLFGRGSSSSCLPPLSTAFPALLFVLLQALFRLCCRGPPVSFAVYGDFCLPLRRRRTPLPHCLCFRVFRVLPVLFRFLRLLCFCLCFVLRHSVARLSRCPVRGVLPAVLLSGAVLVLGGPRFGGHLFPVPNSCSRSMVPMFLDALLDVPHEVPLLDVGPVPAGRVRAVRCAVPVPFPCC